MESPYRRQRISRIDIRYRHLAEDLSPQGETAQGSESELLEEEEVLSLDDVNEPLLIREQKGRAIMGRGHRMFHRRQAAAASPGNVLTVVVDVIATVDASGNVIAKETVTPDQVQPAGVVPTVPAVPPFPSDLTVPAVPAVPTVALPSVPAYPFTSGYPSVQAVGPSSQLVISSPVQTSDPSSAPTAFPSTVGLNSTISSTLLSSPTLSSSLNSTSSTSSSSSTSSTSSTSPPSTTSPSQTPSASNFGGGGGGPANTAAPPAATTAASDGGSSSDSGPLDTPKVVGTVFGALGGVALLLLFVLFFLKRKKQKIRGALQLPGNDAADSQPIASSGQQMATTPSSFVPAGATAFFSRFSGASRSTAETSTTGEKGFQRISGRKLPSAFSEGMTSEQFARGEGTLSGSSFYRDDQGVYGGPGAAVFKEFGKETGEPSNSGAMGTKERIMPSPARTPVIHHPEEAPPFGASRNGGTSPLSPPHSPNPDLPPRGTLGRSHPSHDGSRGSRFTEDV